MAIKYGAAANDPSKFIGALTALAGDETRAKQALALAEQLTPELKEFDPYVAAMKYFTGMTAAASQPGATVFGSAAQAFASPVAYLQEVNDFNDKIKASTPKTAVTLAQALKPPAGKVTYRPATEEELKKYGATSGQIGSDGKFYDLSKTGSDKVTYRVATDDELKKYGATAGQIGSDGKFYDLSKTSSDKVTYRVATEDELKKYGATAGQIGSDGKFYDLSKTGSDKVTYRIATDDELKKYGSVAGQMGSDGKFYPITQPAKPVDKVTYRIATKEELEQYGSVSGQMGSDGKFYPIKTPTGMSIEADGKGGFIFTQGDVQGQKSGRVDKGYIQTTLKDGTTEQRVVPGSLAFTEVETKRANFAEDIDKANFLLNNVEKIIGRPKGANQTAILPNPNLEDILGPVQGRIPGFLNSEKQDLLVKVQFLSSNAFMQAFESLKGGGQITEREGDAAKAALARIQRTQSVPAFIEGLNEFADIIRRARSKATNLSNSLPKNAGAIVGGADIILDFETMSPSELKLIDVDSLTTDQRKALAKRLGI